MGRFSIPPGLVGAGKEIVRRAGQAAGVVGANVKAGIQLAKDHPVATSGIGVVGLAAGGITGYAGMGNQSNPRPTTPTPAEDAGSVSPTAPTSYVGNRATRSMGEAPTAPVASPSRSGAMTSRGTQSLGQVRPGYTPPAQSGRQAGSPPVAKPSASPTQSDGNFISRATDGLNRFMQERKGGERFRTQLGNKIYLGNNERKFLQEKGGLYQKDGRNYLDGKYVTSTVDNMTAGQQFKWGGVDRKWVGVDVAQMRAAGVTKADLVRHAMQSAPQGNYKYEGSNQYIVDRAADWKSGIGSSFQVPVAQGQEHILNEYIQKRLAQKGMKK